MRKRKILLLVMLSFIAVPTAMSQSPLDFLFILQHLIFYGQSTDSYIRVSGGPSYLYLKGSPSAEGGLLRGGLCLSREDYFRSVPGLGLGTDLGIDSYGGKFRSQGHSYRAEAWHIHFSSYLAYAYEGKSGIGFFTRAGFNYGYALSGSTTYSPQSTNGSPLSEQTVDLQRFHPALLLGLGLSFQERSRIELLLDYGLNPIFTPSPGPFTAVAIKLNYSIQIGDKRAYTL